MKFLKYDKIGYWSEIKLDIIKEYAEAYTTIMVNQKNPPFKYIYIDAFAGAGQHISKNTGEFIQGSPLNALHIENRFLEYHFIDLEDIKVAELEKLVGDKEKNVFVYHGDCNQILPKVVLPRAKYNTYGRALCVLDPYGLHLNWEIIRKSGEMKSVEIFLNFPVMDINMNVLTHEPNKVKQEQVDRMNAFWGDESWRQAAYIKSPQQTLWGESIKEKVSNEEIQEAFRKRLINIAGFEYVPKPMPMRNSKGVIVYYLFFASQNRTGAKIVENIFDKYSNRSAD